MKAFKAFSLAFAVGILVFTAITLCFFSFSKEEEKNTKSLVQTSDVKSVSVTSRVVRDMVHTEKEEPVMVHVDLSGLKNTVEGQ